MRVCMCVFMYMLNTLQSGGVLKTYFDGSYSFSRWLGLETLPGVLPMISRFSLGGKTHSECQHCPLGWCPRLHKWKVRPAPTLILSASSAWIHCDPLPHAPVAVPLMPWWTAPSNRELWGTCLVDVVFVGYLFYHDNRKGNWCTTLPGSLILWSLYHHGQGGSRQMNDTRDGSLPSVSLKGVL